MSTTRTNWLWLIAGLLILPFALSTQSIWIDEAQTWTYVAMSTPGKWITHFLSDTKSEALMPLSMMLAWFWGQLLGTSELALRLPNLFYLGIGAVAIWRIGVQCALPWLVLLFSFNPFLWQYADEARPYALQIGLGAVIVAAFWQLATQDRSQLAPLLVFLGGCNLLSATSLLAVVPVGMLCLALGTLWIFGKRPFSRYHCYALVLFFLCQGALGVFYLWGMLKGSTGALLWDVGIGNLAFAAYELAGFSGLGPGRLSLREAAQSGALRQAIFPFALPLILGLTVVGSALANGRPPSQVSHRRAWLVLVGVSVGSMLGLFVLAKLAGFPFWGRHLAPILPALVVAMGIWIGQIRNATLRASLAMAILLVYGASSLQLRHHPRFAKDDYRTAAEFAHEAVASGRQVWWAADRASGIYYGLNLPEKNEPGNPTVLMNVPADLLGALPTPDLILLSKADIYDGRGEVQQFLDKAAYTQSRSAQAFSFWERKK